MVSFTELWHRCKDNFRFSQQELVGILAVTIVSAFIFSFRDWGAETFDLALGIRNLLLTLIIIVISLFFRLSLQKIQGLFEGFKAEFKTFWLGIVIALVLAFITNGRFPIILAGAMVTSFMVKLRLGEFRYGHSYWLNGIIAFWGIIGNFILALFSALGLYLFPGNYFFHQGLIFNIIMAWCAMLPLPQLDGLSIFWGSRMFYYIAIGVLVVFTVLLISQNVIGLIVAWILAIIAGIINWLTMSEV